LPVAGAWPKVRHAAKVHCVSRFPHFSAAAIEACSAHGILRFGETLAQDDELLVGFWSRSRTHARELLLSSSHATVILSVGVSPKRRIPDVALQLTWVLVSVRPPFIELKRIARTLWKPKTRSNSTGNRQPATLSDPAKTRQPHNLRRKKNGASLRAYTIPTNRY
jgi:hypothetical protein